MANCDSSATMPATVFIAVSTKHVDSIDAIPNVTFCYPKFFLKAKMQGKGHLSHDSLHDNSPTISVELGVSNSVANYMVLIFFSTGTSILRTSLERYNQGLFNNTSVEYDTKLKPFLDADKELKGILQSNNMELEDLFWAMAIPCGMPCVIKSLTVDNCCQYVRVVH